MEAARGREAARAVPAAAGWPRRLPVDVRAGYPLLAPALAAMFLINVYPILYSL